MELALIGVSAAALIFSLYQLFLSTNAMDLGSALLRTALSVLAVMAARFDEPLVLTTSVLLFILISILVMALVRDEVQIKND